MTALRRTLQTLAMLWGLAVVCFAVTLAAVSISGRRIEAIVSPSMSPSIPEGSAALVHPLSPAAAADLEVGEVVLFRYPGADRLVMHRIVAAGEQNGTRFYQTQGDANDEPDARLVPATDVESRVEFSAPNLGVLLRALRPPLGLLWLVGVPAALLWTHHALERTRPTARHLTLQTTSKETQ